MNEIKTIVTDLDDTICNTAEEIMKYAMDYHINVLHRTNPVKKSINCKDYYYFKDMLDWNDEETIGFFRQCYPLYLSDIQCKRDVAMITEKLKKMGYEIHICSARRSNSTNYVYDLTKKWLQKNQIIYDKLIIDQVDKLYYVNNIKNVIFIDDSFENCQSVAENTKHVVYMMSTNYNQKFYSADFMRVSNWIEIYNLLK